MTDTDRLNWLEEYVKDEGGIVLHNGAKIPDLGEFAGLKLDRSLRETIDTAALWWYAEGKQ